MLIEAGPHREFILESIPQRGDPPYFVHSGPGGMFNQVHGVMVADWVEAVMTICDLTDYGQYQRGEQILINVPEGTGRLMIDKLVARQNDVVLDMNNSDDA